VNDRPLAYFITFGTYGTWLPGDERGSVDREHAEYNTDFLPPDSDQQEEARRRMAAPAFVLDAPSRTVVLCAIREVCTHRGWLLHAAHVRTNHVHVVVTAEAPPEKVMNDFKAYASRALNTTRPDAKRWRRHGSTKYLWTEEQCIDAIDYALNLQGEPMERFQNRDR
jgi:REP element-mobilizing transposase RayT